MEIQYLLICFLPRTYMEIIECIVFNKLIQSTGKVIKHFFNLLQIAITMALAKSESVIFIQNALDNITF